MKSNPPLLSIIAVLFLFLPATGYTSPFSFGFTGALSEQYNDNVFLTRNDPTEDLVTVISIGLKGAYDAERTGIGLSANLKHSQYRENNDQDNTDQFYKGSWRCDWTERVHTLLNSSYTDDQRRDRILEETGLLTVDSNRQVQNHGFSGQYSISELSAMSMNYQFLEERYDDPSVDDLTDHTIQVGLNADLSSRIKRTTGALLFRYNRYRYSNSYSVNAGFPLGYVDFAQIRDIDNFAFSPGLTHLWTEQVKLNASAGVRYSRYKVELHQSNRFMSYESSNENDPWGYIGNLSLSYSGMTTSSTVSFSHDLVPASGLNGLTERSNLRLRGTWHPYDKWYVNGVVDLYLNRSDQSGATADIDQLTTSFIGTLRYIFKRDWSLGLSYSFYHLTNRHTDTHAQRNRLSLSLSCNLPVLE